jgi:hypothetical protein
LNSAKYLNIGHLNFDYLGQSFSNTGLNWLVVLIILKNMSSSIGRIIPYIVENIMEQENDHLVGGFNLPL